MLLSTRLAGILLAMVAAWNSSALAQDPTVLPPPVAEEEILVRGGRPEVGQTTLSARDIRQMPGAFGDPFRAIEALPGVTPVLSGLPYFFIRGAPTNNTGYFLDGIRVPLLFHVGLGPGVIHPGLVDRVDVFPGAPPASYGGFAGAVIAGRTREASPVVRGEANLRLFDAGALVESPFADGRGSLLLAGRYGYPGFLVGLITPDQKLGYSDYQLRASWRLTGQDTVGVFAFGSHDYLAHRDHRSQEIVEDLVSDFHRIDLRYDHELAEGRLRLGLTLGHDAQGAFPTYITDSSVAARLELEQNLSDTMRLRGGADARLDRYGFTQSELGPRDAPVPVALDPPPTNRTVGAHADLVWRLAPRVELVPGARFDLFESTRASSPSHARASATEPAFDPRFSARIKLSREVSWVSAFGLSHQYPALRVGIIPAQILSVPGFSPEYTRLQSIAQASQGVEVALPEEVVLTATGFLSASSGLADLTAPCIQVLPASRPRKILTPGVDPDNPPADPYSCPDSKPVHRRTFGLELLVRRSLSKRLSGWLSYTLSRSTRESHFLTLSGADAVATTASESDRRHALNAILAYDLGRRWRAGGRFVFYTGAPYSKLSGNVPVPPYNSERLPAFFRVDLRLEKRWPLGEDGSIAFVFEVQNATLSKEVSAQGLDCKGDLSAQTETTTCGQPTMGPITIPSVGVEAFF